MTTNREELKRAVQEMLNDVIEQGFHHLVYHPQQSNELNLIISDATKELNYQLLKLDSHDYKPETQELNNHYNSISKETQRTSLDLLSRLQKVRELDNPRLKRI